MLPSTLVSSAKARGRLVVTQNWKDQQGLRSFQNKILGHSTTEGFRAAEELAENKGNIKCVEVINTSYTGY